MTDSRFAQPASTPTTPSPPAAPGTEVTAGPWGLTVLEVVAGGDAAAAIATANAENPAAPESLQPMLVRLAARNGSDRPLAILRADFAARSTDGILRRSPTIVVPDPAFGAVVEPGATNEGWLPFNVNDPASAVLTFAAASLGGSWAGATLGLTDSPFTADAGAGEAEESDAGSEPQRAVAIGEAVRTGGFEIVIQEVITGQEVFDRSDFRLQALGPGYDNITLAGGGMATLVALYATVTNVSAYPAYFSPSAFTLTDPQGEPWDHTLTMTGPEPDLSREYAPGASGEGWATYQYPGYGALDLIRVLPFPIGGSPRFVAFAGGSAAAADEAPDTSAEEPVDFAPGDTAETTEDRVNLRAEPAAAAEILTELPLGSVLTITGDAIEADGYTWWPVETATGESGYVVADFLAPIA